MFFSRKSKINRDLMGCLVIDGRIVARNAHVRRKIDEIKGSVSELNGLMLLKAPLCELHDFLEFISQYAGNDQIFQTDLNLYAKDHVNDVVHVA